MKRISVFGSSRPKPGTPEYQLAYDLGQLIARAGFVLCNGGYYGTMEAGAKGAKDAGGKTIGIVTEEFGIKANAYIVEKIVTHTFVDRLWKLVELGDAYIVLKGSTGTLLELAAVWEFANKGITPEKPIIVIGTFWKPVLETLRDERMHEGLGSAADYVSVASTPQECIALLENKLTIMQGKATTHANT